MKKRDFINELKKQTGYEEKDCIIINNVLENNFIFGKNNKIKIINELTEKLNIDETEADEIYNLCMNIINKSVVNKLIHPIKW